MVDIFARRIMFGNIPLAATPWSGLQVIAFQAIFMTMSTLYNLPRCLGDLKDRGLLFHGPKKVRSQTWKTYRLSSTKFLGLLWMQAAIRPLRSLASSNSTTPSGSHHRAKEILLGSQAILSNLQTSKTCNHSLQINDQML